MVVVLDTIESEKLRLEADYIEELPFLDTHVRSNLNNGNSSSARRSRRLSRKTQWILLTAVLLLTIGTINLITVKKRRRVPGGGERLRFSIDSANQGRRLGFLDTILDSTTSEELFVSIPSTKSAISASRKYASRPHIAGSEEDLDDARSILELFQTQFGIPVPTQEPVFSAGSPQSQKAIKDIPFLLTPQAWIDTYYPVMNMPLDRSVEILGEDSSPVWAADLVEDGDPGDPVAARFRDFIPTFHGLSMDGEVEGQLVYANYGRKEDYDALEAAGADLTGKIVIVRYGGIFRGLKVKGAQERGAVGVLIYSDLRDDGAVTAENGYETYPNGPARNPDSVQRGSVQFISMYPGDPTTPGYPAYENVTRSEALNKPSIPSLPISWNNAKRLLEEIGDASENRLLSGKSSARKIRLVNHNDEKVTPIWNTMAVIPGHIKDEVVIVGNHRDAWVLGGADPISGTVSLHEIIRGFGALLRSGWRPMRTILFASWDAEEYGLVGSTEWGEDFEDWIRENVVAYLNTDVSSAGSRYSVSASPSLSNIIVKTAKDLAHPTEEGKSLWDARTDSGPFGGAFSPEFEVQHEVGQKIMASSRTGVHPLGSGSDYTVFLQRIGIASTDQGFEGTPNDAPYHYHSIYDSQKWQEVYADPGFHRHVAIAKSLGLLALRMSDAVVVPLNTTQYALELDDYLDVVEHVNSDSETEFTALRKSITNLQQASYALDAEKKVAEERLLELLKGMHDTYMRERSGRRHKNFWFGVRNVLRELFGISPIYPPRRIESADVDSILYDWFNLASPTLEKEEGRHLPRHTHVIPPPDSEREAMAQQFPVREVIEALKRVRRINKMLTSFERGFISEGGIKDREWYRHLGVAPGKWLGYGATTFPALTEALTIENNSTLAAYEAKRLQKLIDQLTTSLHI